MPGKRPTLKRYVTLDRSTRAELLVLALALANLALSYGLWANGAPLWLLYAAIGIAAAIGLTLYFTQRNFDQPLRRRMVLLLLGSSLFGAAALRDPVHALFQIEGFFFDLLGGVMLAAVIHYLLAKIIGPLLFGRVWCSWACWTALVLDQLPYKRSRGRLPGRWGMLRYVHFLLSFALVAALWYAFAYRPGLGKVTALAWFLGGNALYLALGVGLAFVLKDNRAFCKYACPVAVPLKLGSGFALLKVKGDAAKCCARRVCENICPMDIRVADYIAHGERVTSSECILCQACISVCPEEALALSFGLDGPGPNRLRERVAPVATE